jgi:ribosomal-protein-alanine N-acetyltransferase
VDLGTSFLRSGARVGIRPPALTDEQEFTELRRASEEFHRPWEPLPAPEPYSTQAFQALVASQGEPARRFRFLLCRLDDGAILGLVNINEVVRGIFQSGYLGYWIGAPFARQGFMREGLRLVIEHAFEELLLHRLEANIIPENGASLALVRSLGFHREGLSPRYLKIAGQWRDHERWALLSDE